MQTMDIFVSKGAEVVYAAFLVAIMGSVGLFFANPFVMADDHAKVHEAQYNDIGAKLDSILVKIESTAEMRAWELKIGSIRDKIDGILDETEKLTVELEEAPLSSLFQARERRKRELLIKMRRLDQDLIIAFNNKPKEK